jgi:predicted O-methyltransferase YrrM
MKETDALDDYILHHIDDEGDYLRALYRDTHLRLLYPRMASGHLQGRLLKMLVKMIRCGQISLILGGEPLSHVTNVMGQPDAR